MRGQGLAMGRRGKLQEMCRGCEGHELGMMGQCMKERERRRRREREREREMPWGCLSSESVPSSQGSPRAQGRHVRVLGMGGGPGQPQAKVRMPEIQQCGELALLGASLSL